MKHTIAYEIPEGAAEITKSVLRGTAHMLQTLALGTQEHVVIGSEEGAYEDWTSDKAKRMTKGFATMPQAEFLQLAADVMAASAAFERYALAVSIMAALRSASGGEAALREIIDSGRYDEQIAYGGGRL